MDCNRGVSYLRCVQGVLEAVGIEADDERLEKLISELKGKDINDVRTKYTRFPAQLQFYSTGSLLGYS